MSTELEKKLGYALPQDVKNLLEQDFSKYAGLVFVRVLDDGYKTEDEIQSFSTLGTFWDDNEYRDFLEDFQDQFELSEDYVESEYLYIIGETNGGSVCMALNGIHKGKIYIADNGDFGITYQSNTLNDFLESLYPDDDDKICCYEDMENAIEKNDLERLKDLIENKGGSLLLTRSSYNDIALFDFAYKNKNYEALNYLMHKGFYGFNRAEKYGLLKK